MSASMSKSSFRLYSSPLKVEEEAPKVIEKQGIVSILGSDCEQTKAASLRRTLSADMSSKKWLQQNGFSPMKKIASSEQLAISAADSSSSSEEDEDYEGEKEFNGPKKELENARQVQVWSSILLQKPEVDSSKLPPPYVHPLVKRSASSLSEKSLQICTESLGSETGSDGFSSYAPSETGDIDEDKEQEQEQDQLQQKELQSFEEFQVVKYNYSTSRKVGLRSFPPPLPSLACSDGPSLHMHSHRENGRLVLEAMSVASSKCFRAQRQDGRLLLTLLNSPSEEPNNEVVIDQEVKKVEEFEEVFDIFDDGGEEENGIDVDEEEEEDEAEMNEKVVMEQAVPKLPSGVINVHRSALVMKKLTGLENRNPTWPHKFNKATKLVEAEAENEEEPTQLPQSLPPPPPVARLIPTTPPPAATSFNAYEYFWKTKPAVSSLKNPLDHKSPPLKNNSNKFYSPKTYEQQESVLMRGNKDDYTGPLFRGCKETRRSLLIGGPYCIATS